MVHSKTPNGKEVCQRADIVIAACGSAEMVKGDWIKDGAAVVDVGINAVDVRSSMAQAPSCQVYWYYKPIQFCHNQCFVTSAQSMPRHTWFEHAHKCDSSQFCTVQDASKKRGYRLVGDVEFSTASERAAYITPVPGGVGPMTIAMLLQNCLEAFQRQHGLQ